MKEREQLIKEIEETPDILVREVLNFLLFIKDKTKLISIQKKPENLVRENPQPPSLLNFIDEINREKNLDSNRELPQDFAQNLDHYLYGSPKEEI